MYAYLFQRIPICHNFGLGLGPIMLEIKLINCCHL
jgi:hypothetical protein